MRLRILAPTRYPSLFNSARQSRHHLERRQFAPFNKISAKIEGVTLFNPLPPRRFDLLHAFNRIPLMRQQPFVIGFESHLPRAYGLEKTVYFRALRRALASDDCRRIVAISHHARNIFEHTHRDAPEWAGLEKKLTHRLPNIPIDRTAKDAVDPAADIFTLAFVGAHFGRKGGCVAVLMARKAIERGLPLRFEIISNLECGGGIWTDPPEAAFFKPYLDLLTLPNITAHPGLPNAQVMDIFKRSHFSLLPTFGDTFGYSAIEAMAVFTPTIGTRQGALAEFIDDGRNGVLLDLATNALGEWEHAASPDRGTDAFKTHFGAEVERLAEAALARVNALMANRPAYRAMRQAARATALERFAAEEAAVYWDDLYEGIV